MESPPETTQEHFRTLDHSEMYTKGRNSGGFKSTGRYKNPFERGAPEEGL